MDGSVVCVPAASPLAGGTIVGVITTREAAPPALRVTTDANVCGQTLPDESLVIDAVGHVSGAVVTVSGVKTPAAAEAVVTNDTCRFVPRVSVLRPKGTVRMSSKDRVMHTVHAAASDQRALFNLSLPIPDVALSRPIDRPGVVTLSCSTHTWMRGFLFVTEELSAVSGRDGTFRLEGVPAGQREVRFWHESLQASPMAVSVKDGETATVSVIFSRRAS